MKSFKKCVIFVNSLYNIIMAVQIRKEMFPEAEFDIVLSNESDGLEKVFQNKELEKIFNNVYFADINIPTRMDRMLSVISPGSMYKKLLNIKDIPIYTDIFMWNPDSIFYSYYMHCSKHNNKFDLHVYGEANIGWFTDMPDSHHYFKQYYYSILNWYVEKRYHFMRVADMDYDFYSFKPEWAIYERRKKVVEIPSVSRKNDYCKLFNNIFSYPSDFNIKEKYIFLGTVWGEESSVEEGRCIVESLVKAVGKDNLIIKKHPRDDNRFYSEYGVKVIEEVFNWDLYCLNNDIDNKVLISFPSTSVMAPCAIYGNKPTVCMYKSDQWNTDELLANKLEPFVEKMKKANPNVHLFETVEALCEFLKES